MSPPKQLPIIDVHVHAMKVNPAFAGDMCPWFLSDMPGADPNQKQTSLLSIPIAQTRSKQQKAIKNFRIH